MADNTKIEWTGATLNSGRAFRGKEFYVRKRNAIIKPVMPYDCIWQAKDERLTQPFRWKKPRKIFVCVHGDLFADNVSNEWIDRVFAVMALCPQHTFQVLTKRADRMREYTRRRDDHGYHPAFTHAVLIALTGRWNTPLIHESDFPNLPNAWLGVSVEDQERADRARSCKGLSNVISAGVRKAKLSGISAHGLRKSRLTAIAESGGSASAIMSWGGHKSLSEAEHYITTANRKSVLIGTEQDRNSANSPTNSANTGGK